jgi:hypothetical protein
MVAKIKGFFAGLDVWVKRIGLLLVLSGFITAGVAKGRVWMDQSIFNKIEQVVARWQILVGLQQANMNPINAYKSYTVKFKGEPERAAKIYITTGENPTHWVFIEDPIFKVTPYRTYWEPNLNTWVFFTQDKDPFHIIKEN